ncbi:hypothetical protein DFS34DRAFT_196475 [Phlyctochytrium arcticum]|nr:hypothetical protein DFS34DRAFT_196475 [Phlyctochytrium arcticum]
MSRDAANSTPSSSSSAPRPRPSHRKSDLSPLLGRKEPASEAPRAWELPVVGKGKPIVIPSRAARDSPRDDRTHSRGSSVHSSDGHAPVASRRSSVEGASTSAYKRPATPSASASGSERRNPSDPRHRQSKDPPTPTPSGKRSFDQTKNVDDNSSHDPERNVRRRVVSSNSSITPQTPSRSNHTREGSTASSSSNRSVPTSKAGPTIKLHSTKRDKVISIKIHNLNRRSTEHFAPLSENNKSLQAMLEQSFHLKHVINAAILQTRFQEVATTKYGIARVEPSSVLEEPSLNSLAQYLREKRKAVFFPLSQTLSAFLMTEADAIAVLHKDLPTTPNLYMSFVDHGDVAKVLSFSRPSRGAPPVIKVSLPSPLHVQREYRAALLRWYHKMPPDFRWLVEGKAIFLFAPNNFSTKELEWLLTDSGAKIASTALECDLCMVHRWFIDQIPLIPNLLELKLKRVPFVLWGNSTIDIGQRPMQLFPKDGGVVTFTRNIFDNESGNSWLYAMEEFLRMVTKKKQNPCFLRVNKSDFSPFSHLGLWRDGGCCFCIQ